MRVLYSVGAAGPSVFIDSKNGDGNSVSRATPARQEAFLASLLYSAIVSIICSALGSLPSLHVQTTAEIILAPQHIVEDYCTSSLGHYTRSRAELAANAT